jgi:hypothetical protein
LVQRLPKRLSFVVDVSGSMAYFNSDYGWIVCVQPLSC